MEGCWKRTRMGWRGVRRGLGVRVRGVLEED